MLRKLISAILLLLALSACSVALQAATDPVALPAPSLSATSPVAENPPALWILDSARNASRLVAMDPQTGDVLLEIPQSYSNQVVSGDGQWRYQVDMVLQGERMALWVTTMDIRRGRIARIVPIIESTSTDYTGALAQLALSPDNRTLAVALTYRTGTEWFTDVSFLDAESGKDVTPDTALPITAVAAEMQQAPSIQLVFSKDGQRVFLLQTRERTAADGNKLWSSQIAVVHVDSRKVERVEVPGEIQANAFWLQAMMAPDGPSLYAVETIATDNADGFRFLAMDTNTLAVRVQLDQESGPAASSCDFAGKPRITPDARYLYTYCPQGYFQFLDLQSGQLVQPVRVDRQPGADSFAWQLLPSADGRLAYLIFPEQKQVAVLDLTQRAIVRSTILKEDAPTPPAMLLGLEQWLATPASAKMYPQPGAALSPDGTRLYFVGLVNFEKGDGLWAVEADSLKLIGHWLRGKDIYGIQLSGDGRELYAISGSDHTLYVLDAITGQVLRAFSSGLQQPSGFLGGEE